MPTSDRPIVLKCITTCGVADIADDVAVCKDKFINSELGVPEFICRSFH